ncbi:MAG: NAD(P)/FAD-dependent oxidoreductase [Bacilli bacterium]|nr:NAD(P)/FAD-dependent oxidoreductase [Bacilli bacterium]
MDSPKFYEDHYDVVVIGAALAGCAAALTLASKGKKVLVLERHNLPGGVATSFVRGGVEMEATLHEMMSIGPEEAPLKIRKFFEEMRVDIDWIRVPEAFRLVTPNVDATIHAGTHGDFEGPAEEIAKACGEKKGSELYKKLMSLFTVCKNVFDSVNELSIHPQSKLQMLKNHRDFVTTAGYSTKEVLDRFNLPKEALELLSAYWIYVGSPFDELPFTIYCFLMGDYLGYGSYVPRNFSHEMSLKMAMRAEEMGVQIEYRQEVEKILVKDGRVAGVRTARGDEINCDYVISGSYPNNVYANMIEPPDAVPPKAYQYVNSKEIGVTCFSVVLLLDESAESLGIKDYSVFHSLGDLDTTKLFGEGREIGPWRYLTSICTNIANPGCTPEGTCIYSITSLPSPSAWFDVTPFNYEEKKNEIARAMIEAESERLGFSLLDHVKEIVIETPVTIAHYTGAFRGSIYGYRHKMDDHIVARLQMGHNEHYIDGLAFAGAHCISGDGMGPAVTNGRKGAKDVLDMMKEREEGK